MGPRDQLKNAVVGVTALGVGAVWWLAMTWGARSLQGLRCPPDTFLGGSPRTAGILIMVPPLFAVLCAGFLLLGLLTGPRMTVRAAASKAGIARARRSHRKEMKGLALVTGGLTLGIMAMGAFVGFDQFCLTPRAIVVRNAVWSSPHIYGWHEIRVVRTGCRRHYGRYGSGWDTAFELEFGDGRKLDIAEGTALLFRHSDEIRAALHRRTFDFDPSWVDPDCSVPYHRLLTERP